MRIVAGTAGGLPLLPPKQVDLRPTQDKVRGALFSSLGERVVDATVLDLFAGSGSLGLEALSRGASAAVFVESHPRCIEAIRENVRRCQFEERARVVRSEVLPFLRAGVPDAFDLVLADPPYDKGREARPEACHALFAAIRPWLAPGGLFVFEHFRRTGPGAVAGFELDRSRNYGDTVLSYFRAA